MIVHDRRIAEIMIEDIFLSSHNLFVLVDYNDIRTIRRKSTFRVLYRYELAINQISQLSEAIKEEISLDGMNYCAIEIAYGEMMTHSALQNLMNIVNGALMDIPRLNCSHLSDNLSGEEVVLNLYLFTPKSEDEREMDIRIDKMLDCYKTIHSPYMRDCETEKNEALNIELQMLNPDIPEPDGDVRLAAYTGVISQLTVNDDSAFFIRQMVDDAVKNLEQDIQKDRIVRISTIQNFVFYAGNLWMHLDGYFTQDELKVTAQRWSRILHDARINSPGYLKEAADFVGELRNIWVENLSGDEFNGLLARSKALAMKGNDTNRADVFSALEKICRDAHYVCDAKKCIASAELAIEIASTGNPEINFLEKRIQMFEELISRNRKLDQ